MAVKFDLPVPKGPGDPPPPLTMLAEGPRAAWSLAQLAARWADLQNAPRGDGRPVLLLPGLVNSDRSFLVMRRYLRDLGYRPYGWELGRNLGVRAIGAEGERLFARVAAVREETGAPVTLVGVSLGGIMARIAAHRMPDAVREVVTNSTPVAGPPTATNVWRAFEWLTGEKIGDDSVRRFLAEAAAPPPVRATAIWSASDGLVNGVNCRDLNGDARSIEVRSSHLWVQMHPDVLAAVAEVLAQPPCME